MKPGEILKKIRFDLGYTRGRQTFIDDYGLSWSAEVQRNLESGVTSLDVDRLDELIEKRVVRKDSEVHQRLIAMMQEKDSESRPTNNPQDREEPLVELGYEVEFDVNVYYCRSFAMLIKTSNESDRKLQEFVTNEYTTLAHAIANTYTEEQCQLVNMIKIRIQENIVFNDILTLLLSEIDKKSKFLAEIDKKREQGILPTVTRTLLGME